MIKWYLGLVWHVKAILKGKLIYPISHLPDRSQAFLCFCVIFKGGVTSNRNQAQPDFYENIICIL